MNEKGLFSRLSNELAEKFATTWRLLSETTIFLSRTRHFNRYEKMLREWRHTLENNRGDSDVMLTIRDEIITLRKTLRKEGYDLTLGSRDIKVEGYRNDAAVREGFTRAVLAITDNAIYYLVGQENHIQLAGYLESQLHKMRLTGIKQWHYLWYRWRNNLLVLSGSDTETKEDFELLKQYVEENKLFMLKQLRKL